jgi:energy-coupling factor transport system permease protein
MGFESCHPAVLYGAAVYDHPVFLGIAWICAAAYHIKRCGRRALVFNLCLIVLACAYALYYAGSHHFGMTVLRKNFIGNNLTLESLVYGLTIGLRAAAVCMWCGSMFQVVSSDKVIYLFGRISPRLSLFLTVLLRFIPRLKLEAGRIDLAQKGIGLGSDQGSLLRRIINCLRIFSMLITWTIQALALEADSMKSRGSRLRGRTAFSIYRFDNRDRAFVIAMFGGIILTGMGMILGATKMFYSPVIIWKELDGLSLATAAGYAFLCLLPMGMEIYTERVMKIAQEQHVQQNDAIG